MKKLIEGKHGPMLIDTLDTFIGKSYRLQGEWAEEELSLLSQLVTPLNVFIDVGANIGSHTVPLSRIADKTYAIEPERDNFRLLNANLILNDCWTVIAKNCAATEVRSHLVLMGPERDQEGNFGVFKTSEMVLPGKSYQKVIGLPLTDIVDMEDIPAVGLIKIDVEGHELAVIKGAGKILDMAKPVLYVEANNNETNPALFRAIQDAGYTIQWHFSPYWNPNNYMGAGNVFPNHRADVNVLCVHRSSDLEVVLPFVQSPDEEIPV
jgi:FkbM family methyltransferase